MKKREVDHVLRAAGRITGEKQFIIIGSQSLHGKFPDLADDLVKSFEVDLMALNNTHRTEWLEVIGAYSSFHESFGYYADPVDRTTATLPKGWQGRLVNLPPGDTEGVHGLCLDPHDLAIAKYVARREKDMIFTRELARRGLVSQERLLALVDQTAVVDDVRERIRTYITKDFSPTKSLDESQGQESDRGKHSRNENRSVFEEMEEIRAKAVQDWLELRRRQTGRSYGIGADRTRGRESDDLAKESGIEPEEDTPE